MLDKKTLFVLGAGSSKSLSDEITNKNISAFGTGYTEMPLGWELVQKISKYRTRSVSRFLCHVIYQIYSDKSEHRLPLNKFNFYSDQINKALKSLYKSDKEYPIEKSIVWLLTNEIFDREERSKLKDFFRKKLKSSGTNSEFVGGFPIIINAISFCILKNHNNHYKNDDNIEDIYRFISEITNEASIGSDVMEFLNFSRISYYKNSNVTTKTVFSDAKNKFDKIIKQSEEILLRNKNYSLNSVVNDLTGIVQEMCVYENLRNREIIKFLHNIANISGNKNNLEELRSIRNKIEYYFSDWVVINDKHKSGFQSSLSRIDLILERERFFRRYITLEGKISDDYIVKKCRNLNNDDVLQYLVTSYIVGYMMTLYSPSSIDDFVMNLEFYTRYEEVHRKKDQCLPSAEEIKKYIKYLIACVLLEDFYATMIFTYGCDNYVKFISRLVISGCQNDETKLKQSLTKLDFINFNYDTTLFALLTEYLPGVSVSEYYNNNVIHPYGRLVYVDAKDEEMENPEKIFDNLEVGIWDKFFEKNSHDYITNGANINVFKQSQKIIDLIREKGCEKYRNNQKEMQKKFLDARIVCFCGFGFDKDNLTYLGLLSEGHKNPIIEVIEKAKRKKIYVSSVNNKIIMTLEEIFECRMIKFAEKSHWDEEKKVYITKHIWRSEGKGNIVASENNLNYALNNDFIF